jgi:hypothetical protein
VRSCGSAIRSEAPATLAAAIVDRDSAPPAESGRAAPGGSGSSQREGGPLPFRAGRGEASAQRPAQPLRDREPEAAAAVEPCDAGVGLGVAVEQPRQGGLRDAGPGVGDLDAQAGPALGCRGRSDADRDAAALGELQRVADQVREHLAQPARVGAQ